MPLCVWREGVPEVVACMERTGLECLDPIKTTYEGMRADEVMKQIATTDLAETCG